MKKYWMTYIKYSDLYGEVVPYDKFLLILKSFRFDECLNYLSKLQILLSKQAFSEIGQLQAELLVQIFPRDIVVRILEEEHKLLEEGLRQVLVIHERQIYNLLMLVLQYCNNRTRRSMEDLDVRREFSHCFLIMNDYIEPTEKIMDDFNNLSFEERKNRLREVVIRGLSFTHTDNIKHLLVRYNELFVDIPRKVKTANSIDINGIFSKAIGMDLQNYFALSFAILAHFEKFSKENIHDSPIDIDTTEYFHKTVVKKSRVKKIFRSLCISRRDFRKEYLKELATAKLKEYSFLTLKRFPLLRIGKRIYSMSHRYLKSKITEGIYYTILDSLETDEQKNKYFIFFGEIFEYYVKSILKRIYPEKQPFQRFFCDILYGKDSKEAGDGLIVYEESLIIVEAKSSRLLASTITSGDINEYKQKVDEAIIKGAKTIERVINDLKNGLISIEGLEISTIRRFYPLIVTIQFFPQDTFLWEFIEERLKDENCLQEDDIARIQVLEVDILENLEPIISSGISLLSILKEKDKNDRFRDLPFSNYIDSAINLEGVSDNQYIDERYVAITDIFMNTIFERQLNIFEDV